jgi:hypothetical protein
MHYCSILSASVIRLVYKRSNVTCIDIYVKCKCLYPLFYVPDIYILRVEESTAGPHELTTRKYCFFVIGHVFGAFM